jgi:hypothetical protein
VRCARTLRCGRTWPGQRLLAHHGGMALQRRTDVGDAIQDARRQSDRRVVRLVRYRAWICRDAERLDIAPRFTVPVAQAGHLVAMKIA